jgi:hypothetical protein
MVRRRGDMKRLGLTVAALLITAGAALFGQDTANFRYEARDGMVTITGYTGRLKDISIPAQIDKLPVTAIWKRGVCGKAIKQRNHTQVGHRYRRQCIYRKQMVIVVERLDELYGMS